MVEYIVPTTLGILTFWGGGISPFLIIFWLIWLGYRYLTKRDRLILIRIFIALLTLYTTTSYLVYYFGGITYFGVKGETVAYITKYSFLSVLCSYIICTFLARKYKMPSLNQIRLKLIGKARKVKRDRLIIVYLLLFLVGSLMWYDVLFTIGSVSPVGNREMVGKLLFGNNHYFQVIIISLTIFLIFLLKAGRKRWVNYWGIFLLIWLWYPTVVVGARKELFIICVVFYLFTNFKTYQKIGVGACFLLYMFGIPLIREGWASAALNILSIQEFILPQYVHFVLFESGKQSINHVSQFSSYLDGVWVFFPGSLRLSEFKPLGVSFFELNETNVALGAHPIGEAWLNFGGWGYPFFIVEYCALIFILFIKNRRYPEFFVVGLPYIALFGRSDLWVTLFFIIYSGVILKLIFKDIKVETESVDFKI